MSYQFVLIFEDHLQIMAGLEMVKEKNFAYIAIIIPMKIEGKRFKPIPIDYISGDNKEEICIINEGLKIDSTGISNQEVIMDFINKFLSNWKNFREAKMAKNYLYNNAPNIQPDEYDIVKCKYLDLEENFQNK